MKRLINNILFFLIIFFIIFFQFNEVITKDSEVELIPKNYERTYLDCIFDTQIEDLKLNKKKIKYINQTKSYCYNRELNYFNEDLCIFNKNSMREKTDILIEFSGNKIKYSSNLLSNSKIITIIDTGLKTVTEEIRIFDEKNNSLGKTTLYGICDMRKGERKF